MQITIKEVQNPIKADPTRQIRGRTSYKIISTDARTFFCKPENRPSDLDKGMVVDIDVWVDNYNNNHINRFTVVNDDNIAPSPQPTPTPQPQAPTTNNYVEEGTAGGHDVADIQSKDWAIILQSLINRNQTISPTNKLKWFLTLYSYGAKEAFERLKKNKLTEEQILDLDNTAISAMPDDKIPF
tara:strand:+ start:7881 stop:8432 length:552 start_codon:yes stop_codon:yes gene_type:complete